MNKNEQAQLCMLLAKLRYELMERMVNTDSKNLKIYGDEMIEAINKILQYTNIQGN